MSKKIHLRDMRLFNNAGMEYPKCRANDKLLNVELHYTITSNLNEVTCKHCLKAFYGSKY